MSGRRWQPSAAVIVMSLVCGMAAVSAQTRRVVIFYDERVEFPGLAALDTSLRATLTAGSPAALEIYRESLDLSRFDSPGYRASLRDHFRAKYEGKRIDVVIAAMGPSLDFLLQHGEEVFPGTPIVFCGIDQRELPTRRLPPHLTGVLVKREFRPTLELALRLHPNTENVVIVAGTTEFDRRLLEQARQEFRPFEQRYAFTYLSDLPMDSALARLRRLPAPTVVLYSTLFRDGAGQPFVPHQAAQLISEAANAPVYAFVDQYVGRGVVGGHVYSLNAHGRVAGHLALQILAGRPVEDLPPAEVGTSFAMFDWRQLRRWGIDAARLPPQSEILFRTPTPWDQYQWYIIAAVALATLQAAIIALLFFERTKRRRSQERYELASVAGGVGVFDWNLATNEVYVDPLLKARLGYADHEIQDRLPDWSRLVHPDDLPLLQERAQPLIAGTTSSYELEHRLLHRDGSVRWFLARGSLVLKHGRPARITGTDTDITERKASEQMLDGTQAELTRVSRLTALGQFAASMAHEVSQPLTSIAANAQASLLWLGKAVPDLTKIRAALQDVVAASKRADELMRRNRELFKLHSVQKETLDINGVVDDAIRFARARLQSSQVSLMTELAPALPPVAGDRIELQQVLLNLIANSIDATLHLPPAARRIRISTVLAADGNVTVSTSDNGVGLEAVDMQRLFKLSYTTKPQGTGIGLSLCRSIIEAHGGALRGQQNEGAGATFWFTLPAHVPAKTISPTLAHAS